MPPSSIQPLTTQPGRYPQTGIVGYHAYLPGYRLERSEIAAAVGSSARGVRCVAGYDEDSTTLGLAVLADRRGGPAGGTDEREGADAAVAFLFGEVDPLARIICTASVTAEFIDRWRAPGAPDGATWEERFGEQRYTQLADQLLTRLSEAGAELGDVRRFAVAGSNAGAAQAGLALADLLDAAMAGETLLLISLADGADALILRATEAIAASRGEPLRAQFDRGVTIGYPQYLLWRERLAAERPRRPDPDRPSAPFAWRNRRYKLSMTGGRCGKCGAVQFPLPRVCYQCHAADDFEPVPASGQTGRIATFTVDRLAFSPSPPRVSAIVAFTRGGRLQCELTDVRRPIRVGDEVVPTFRRGATVGGIRNYIWKARPVYPTTPAAAGQPGAAGRPDAEPES